MTDPRIVALAKDPRTGPVLVGIVKSGGDSARAGSALELLEFNNAVNTCGLSFRDDAIGSGLLTYMRSAADGLVADALDSLRRDRGAFGVLARALQPELTQETAAALVVAVLRGDRCDQWPAVSACSVTDALVDAELLAPDEEPAPLQLTPLGRAVLLLLEQRAV